MRLRVAVRAALLLAASVLTAFAAGGASNAQRPLPSPVLVFIGQEFFEANGKQWTRYRFEVENRAAYPDEMFAAAPELPPCGNNAKAARTWVELYEQRGKRLNGFCALGDNDGLGRVWFALEADVVPPSWVYVELNDRKTGTKYKSNLAETTQ